jgi:hypothetical protein
MGAWPAVTAANKRGRKTRFPAMISATVSFRGIPLKNSA